MAKLLLAVVVTVLSISVITEAQLSDSCPPNCQQTVCTFTGCQHCDSGYCHYSDDLTRKIICVTKCPDGMYCESSHRMCIPTIGK